MFYVGGSKLSTYICNQFWKEFESWIPRIYPPHSFDNFDVPTHGLTKEGPWGDLFFFGFLLLNFDDLRNLSGVLNSIEVLTDDV